ncbi:uncharacterized protein LOC142644106 [Castanea sativa]|uniref:uncharacterized protein LOC142644106 n=1 Tax=Castanea sativa TaxID=21020 RepID=UPI003F64F386
MEVEHPDHRRPVYLMATINGVQVRRALVDTGVSLNLIALSTLEAVGLTDKRIQGAPIEITGFGGSEESTKGYVQLALRVGPIVALTRFHVINSEVSYHVLLGRPRLHKHRLIPSMYHQCVKRRLNGKPVRIPANHNPLSQGEVNFVETMFYDELESDGESATPGTPGAPEGPRPSDFMITQEEIPKELVQKAQIQTEEKLIEINLEAELGSQKPVFISSQLTTQEKEQLVALLQKYMDVFAWTYDEMPSLDPELVVHSLNVDPRVKPVVQPVRVFHTNVEAQITQEVKKLLAAAFVKPIQHPKLLSNIVPMKKQNDQIRCCVDFRNLNKACPKDEFSLPNIDLLVDSALGTSMFLFMDGYSGYNQICMAAKDVEKTAFKTPIGNFYYTIMPFGLKNAGATY